MDFLPSIDTLGGFLALALGFGFIILVHEAGHFFAARWAGIQVSQFAIGFGPSLLTWRAGRGWRIGPQKEAAGPDGETSGREVSQNLGETEYCLKLLPLGGYVKMLGQDDLDPSHRSRDPRSYNAKTVGERMVVISAGVVMNLIFAMLFFVIAFMAGVDFPPAIVGGTVADSPAAVAYAVGHDGEAEFLGLRPGDEIVRIDGRKVRDFTDLRLAAALSAADRPLELTVVRPGSPRQLTYRITPKRSGNGLPSLGIGSARSLTLADTSGLNTAQAGLRRDMRLVAVDGTPVTRFDQFLERLEAAGGEVELRFLDPESGAATTFTASTDPDAETSVMALPFRPLETRIRADDPLEALQLGALKTTQTMQSVYLTLLRLFQRQIPVEQMRGPIGIADTGTRIARDRGLTYLLYFLGLISVNLAVINFLPIPVVDGGHMVFLALEGVKGSPVSPRLQAIATYVGMMLILSIFLVTLFYDTARLIGG